MADDKPAGDVSPLDALGSLPTGVKARVPWQTLLFRPQGDLDPAAWTPNPIFPFLREHGNVAPDEMYRVFNMGIGYTLIVRPAFADAVCTKLARMGETAMVIGEIVKGSGDVRI